MEYELTATVPLKATTTEEAIREIGGTLLAQGYVKETFVDAVLAREKIFPTGLPTPGYHVAIPHTDPEHVIQPAIGIGVLQEPVIFSEMGNPESQLPIHLICMLAVTQADCLVHLLNSLVTSFQNDKFLKAIIGSANANEAMDLFTAEVLLKGELHG